jgi:hypothetical protein
MYSEVCGILLRVDRLKCCGVSLDAAVYVDEERKRDLLGRATRSRGRHGPVHCSHAIPVRNRRLSLIMLLVSFSR